MVSPGVLVKQSRAWGLWSSWSSVLWALWKTRGMRSGEKSYLRLNPFHFLLWGSLKKAWEVKSPLLTDPGVPGFASEDKNSLEFKVDLPCVVSGVGMGVQDVPSVPTLG